MFLVLLLLSCTCGTQPERVRSEPVGPAVGSMPELPEEPLEVPELPEGTVLQVFRTDTGYRLRIDAAGQVTRGDQVLKPVATALQHPEKRKAYAQALAGTWGALSAEHEGAAIGPLFEEGKALPNHRTLHNGEIAFSARQGEVVHTVRVLGDLRLPESLGPLGEAWKQLSDDVFGPSK